VNGAATYGAAVRAILPSLFQKLMTRFQSLDGPV
jgi:hypothetical protein